MKISRTGKLVTAALVTSLLLAGCTSKKIMTLMPTPVIYQNSSIDPFAHLAPELKTITTNVFFATNRMPDSTDKNIFYGNKVDSVVHLGKAIVRMGVSTSTWHDLHQSSLSSTKENSIPLVLEKVTEIAVLPNKIQEHDEGLTSEQKIFIEKINAELKHSPDKEIMVYVHGTKVDFTNAAILTAEVDHFAGRDFVGLAFAWPSHQNILSYMTGVDVKRALNSSESLENLLLLLSGHTIAKHINILSYSAGGKIASKALFELRQKFKDMNADQLKEKFNFGSVVFAAADVEVNVFLERLPAISEISNQVVLTVTDDDNALKAAKLYMGGTDRVGSAEAEKIEKEFIVNHHLSNVEIIDVSVGKEERGFNIVGHHYWYRHPWMSSEIIFLMRTDLPAARRGLTPTETEGIWYLSNAYPDMIRTAMEEELKGQW